MKKENKVWAITLIAYWFFAPIQNHAQDSLRTVNLQEIVVTATKFAKSKSETGKILTVIDESQLKQSKGKDLSQLLNEQVGLVVNGANSNTGKDKSVYLQGAGNGYTLILLDGIPLNDPSTLYGGAYDLRLLPLDQIEKIEILKGSQSTLYGSDAVAGVINIISKKVNNQSFSGFGSAGYGSYQTDKENAGVSGTVGRFDYQVGYSHFHTKGISEARDETHQGNYDKDGASQNACNLLLGIRPSAHFVVRPYLRYNTFEGKYDGGAFTDDETNNYKAKLINTGLTSRFDTKKGSVNLLYGYDDSNRTYQGTYPGVYEGLFQNMDLFWNHSFNKQFQLLAGVQYQHWKMTDETAVEKIHKASIVSPYTALYGKFGKGIFLEIGGRYNNHSKFGQNFTYSFNPSWVINKRIKVFFNHSTGFKSPTLTQLFGQYGANPDLKPEKSKSIEGGVQWFSRNSKIDLRANWFDRRVDDVIIYNSNYQYVNFDKQHDHGFEIESTFKITENVTLKLFDAYVTGEVETKANNVPIKYNNLIRRPKNTLGMNLGWRFNNVFASLNIKSFSKRNDQFFDPNDYQLKEVVLAAYTLVDLYVEYSLNKKIKFYVDGKNLLDQKYQEVYGYNTFRFNVMAGVNVNF